jgi:hypothetical protein
MGEPTNAVGAVFRGLTRASAVSRLFPSAPSAPATGMVSLRDTFG